MYCSFLQLPVRGLLFEYYWSVLMLQKNIVYYSHSGFFVFSHHDKGEGTVKAGQCFAGKSIRSLRRFIGLVGEGEGG